MRLYSTINEKLTKELCYIEYCISSIPVNNTDMGTGAHESPFVALMGRFPCLYCFIEYRCNYKSLFKKYDLTIF